MTMSGLDIFDRTLHESNAWLKAIMLELETDGRHIAYDGLRATLHALRDRMPPEDAVHLGAQLPTLLRGIYYEGWKPAVTPTRERHLDEFLGHVATLLPPNLAIDAEAMARAVFATMVERLDAFEIAKVIHTMPHELRVLWPAAPVQGVAAKEAAARH